ncbi:MAG: DUF2797 domain-containing protein [Pseudomonadota bacterium]
MSDAGQLRKMAVTLAAPVDYRLRVGADELPLNSLIGERVKITYHGRIECINCGRLTKKSYSQGHCYPCSQRLASCDMCIVRPHTCHYHEGTCREPDWGDANCMQPHVVYLANSSGLKVGVTRRSQIPTRWIDQGAAAALPIVAASTRRIAGLLEVAIAKHVSDKTDWRRMLRGEPEATDLVAHRDELLEAVREPLERITEEFGPDAYAVESDPVAVQISYPVTEYPIKVRSLTLDKLPEIDSVLLGIKGQYLILEAGVMNVRRHSGYVVSLEAA